MSQALRVLIVEDEALLALDLEQSLLELGHVVVGTAASSGAALRLAGATRPDVALVDVHLLDGPTGVEAGRRIAEHEGAAVLFMTANVKRLPDDLAGALGVMGKPFTANGLASAMAFLGGALGDGAPPPPPWSLQLAPSFAAGADGHFRIERRR